MHSFAHAVVITRSNPSIARTVSWIPAISALSSGTQPQLAPAGVPVTSLLWLCACQAYRQRSALRARSAAPFQYRIVSDEEMSIRANVCALARSSRDDRQMRPVMWWSRRQNPLAWTPKDGQGRLARKPPSDLRNHTEYQAGSRHRSYC